MANIEILIEACKFSFIFRSGEPIPESELLSWLLAEGFEKISDIPKRIGTTTFGIERMNIARKKTSEVLYDDSNGVLIVTGKHPKEAFGVFNEVMSMLEKNEFDIANNVRSYEFGLNGRVFVKGKFKPLDKIAEFMGTEKFSKFSDILGEEVIPFDIRFCPKRESSTSESFKTLTSWFDIHIFPNVINPNYYTVRAVFRDPSVAKMIKFSETIDAKISSILSVINERKTE
jgi:hypothetical protein